MEQTPSLRQMIVPALGLVVFITVLTIGIQQIGIVPLQQWVQQAGVLAPLAYIALKAVTYVFAPLTSGPIQLVSGTLFDSVPLGVFYTVVGETLGGSMNFWLARWWGRPLVRRLVGQAGMLRVEEFYQTRLTGWQTLIIGRLLFFTIWDFLSYAAGLTSVRFRDYLWVSLLVGAIPTFFFVWIGDAVVTNPPMLIVAYGLVVLGIVVPLLLRSRLQNRRQEFTITHHE